MKRVFNAIALKDLHYGDVVVIETNNGGYMFVRPLTSNDKIESFYYSKENCQQYCQQCGKPNPIDFNTGFCGACLVRLERKNILEKLKDLLK